MASEGQTASRPIHQRSVPSPESAARELPRAIDKRPRNTRPIVQLPQPATTFLGQAIAWDLVHQRVYSRFPSANRKRREITLGYAPELRLTRMEFPVAGLLHLRRGQLRR